MADRSTERCGAVRDWMTKQPATVAPDSSIGAALARMRRAEVRHLLVVEADRLVGIVSHRDWRRLETGETPAGWESQAVARIMTEDPVTVAPETPVTAAARVLLERKIGCLPVRDGEAIVGIFTTSDALEALLSALE
jgi:acetoin utilization protein AcuB